MKIIRHILVFSLLLIFFACNKTNAKMPNVELTSDSDYYLGLRACDEGKEAEAMRLFVAARKNGSDLVARRSAEALTQLGNVTQRHNAALHLIERWKDDTALLVACKELFKNKEYSEIIRHTRAIDLGEAPNELVELRLKSLIEKNDSRFEREYFRWIVSRPLSAQHVQFYQTYVANQLKKIHIQTGAAHESDISVSREQIVIDFRISVYQQKYQVAFSVYEQILAYYEDEMIPVDDQLLSDIGKAALYGADDCAAAAQSFDALAEKLPKEKKFYALFYAARLYDKGGQFRPQTESRFTAALEVSPNALQFDNCLWYLLSFLLRTSTDDAIGTLKTYGPRITSPDYFDDFFESLSVRLISERKWQDFVRVWSETGAHFSERTAGKYAYISGRLIEEGLADGGDDAKSRAEAAFGRVVSGGGDLYYKILALERLGITERSLVEEKLLSGAGEKAEDGAASDKSAQAGKLLSGYVTFGFPQQIYSEWLLNRENLTVADSIHAAAFLQKCEKFDTEDKFSYGIQSLRIASRTKNNCGGTFPKELLELCHPQLYASAISRACEQNGLPEYLLFALVRTESFFDRTISSRAGAMGLTQLMEATAAEEARKLKLGNDYDIFDAQTNVLMGAHYLKSLIDRTEDNSVLLALCAYNGGLTNVRRWIQAARNEWTRLKKPFREPAGMSMDLFLETIPFAETRDYGRKLIEASAVYAWLYYDKMPTEVAREILGAE